MNLDDALGQYLVHRVKTHPRSYKDHATTLYRFQSWLGTRELASIRTDEIEHWRDRQPVKPQTANQYVRRVAAFFGYCRRRNWVPGNPCDMIEPLREERPHQVRIAADLFPLLLDNARHPRDRALVALSLELLLRGGEIRRLRVGDLDLDKRVIRVQVSKGKDEFDVDEMAISDALARELADWLRAYRRLAGLVADGTYLFPRMDGRRAGREYAYRLVPAEPISHPWEVVRHSLARVGHPVEAGTGFHAIRRSAARVLFDHLIDQDNPYDSVLTRLSSLMHHSSRATTERYLGVRGDRVLRNRIIHDGGATALTLSVARVTASLDKPARAVSALSEVS